MKANELRLGNWIHISSLTDGSEIDVECKLFHLQEMNTTIRYHYKPIPLTEEWLLKFGFEHHNNKSEYFNEQVFMKDVEDNGNIKTITVKILSSGYQVVTKYEVLLTNEYRWGEQLVGRVYWKDDLYVHQLQNLYFALTGEELTLKS